MKKTLVSILIFMFTATVSVCAQIYNNQEPGNNNSAGQNGYYSTYSDVTLTNSNENAGSSGLFKDTATGPGGRPVNGEGIGQEAPLGNGLNVLIACSVIYGIVLFFKMKSKNK